MAGNRRLLALLSRPNERPWTNYLAACGLVAAAALLRIALDDQLRNFPLLIYIPAICAAALLLDCASGIMATVLSALCAAYFFAAPTWSFGAGLRHWFALAIVIVIGVAISMTLEALRQTIRLLQESERANALLLDELVHRTRNDLAIISSALTLQSRASANEEVREALESANTRVLVIAQAQQKLKPDKTGGRIDLCSYLSDLCQGLGNLLRDVRPIAVRVSCEAVQVPKTIAITLGLVVNELVTNSMKYAYPTERGGRIEVVVRANDSGIILTVADDGVGCAPDVTPGLGSKLIRLLVKQHGGTVGREPSEVGHCVRVEINDPSLAMTA